MRLSIIAGPDQGREIAWSEPEFHIGSGRSCTLILTDPTVSRTHCVLKMGPEGPSIHDLGSTNGTMVGGYRVDSAYLRPGAVIGLGRTHIRFEAGTSSREVDSGERYGLMLGNSRPMHKLFDSLRRVSSSNATVLIEGETGTGKELIAETIHNGSQRAHGPFVVFDCARVAPTLLESELFGHERGSFTGANETRIGVIESADGGTVFLDEIGELSLDLQPKLLRALERQEICRIGSSRTRRLNVRILSATNRDLRAMVRAGEFRQDLFYRLDVVKLKVPPLRERREDIPLLGHHFLRQITGDASAELPEDLLAMFRSHSWPGNVRELRSAVERWILLGKSHHRLVTEPIVPAEGTESGEDDEFDLNSAFRDVKARVVSQWERSYLEKLMSRHDGNVSRAARAVRMSRNYLTELLQRYRVQVTGE
jgi:transcriptional regulator with PAS, ATPase and Fis domain